MQFVINILVKILFILIFFYFSFVKAEELVVPITKYFPLSKTIATEIIGSSTIIIDKNEISKYPNFPVSEIIALRSGIKSSNLYGINFSGSKTTIDIRGMGAQAKSNVLILVNGQRLNNIDMSEVDFPSIPLKSIERIEIIKGNAAAVLYGDGAIGGSINFITKVSSAQKNINDAKITYGTFNLREISWNYVQSFGLYSHSSYFNNKTTDGYRDHNEQMQTSFESEVRYAASKGDVFLKFGLSDQNMNTPGDRSQNQIYTDRKGTDTANDYIKSDGASILFGGNYKINDNNELILDSSFRLKDSYSDLQTTSFPSYSETLLKNYQFTPRINTFVDLFGKKTNFTYGLDLQYADYYSHRKKNQEAVPLHVYDAWQSTQSLYFQQSINLTENIILGSGLRFQRNNIAIGDHLEIYAPDYAGWQKEHDTFSNQENNYASNIGLNYNIAEKISVYGRIGNGFRYPNIDDRIGGSGGTSLSLLTQKTKDLEIGSEYLTEKFSFNFSTYIIEGKNELAYDTDVFENINMNSTRRYGAELEIKNKINDKLNIINNFTILKAQYTSGDQGTYATDFNGNDVPLVPLYSLNSVFEWNVSKSNKIISFFEYQDEMRMESDDENFQPKIPNYFIAGLGFFTKFDKFFLDMQINNIFNDTYYNYAVSSSSTLGSYNVYPMPGREMKITLGTEF